jgi:hypothetical protein
MKQTKFLRFLFLVVLSLVLISTVSGAAFAATSNVKSKSSSPSLTSSKSSTWEDIVKRADPYVHIVNGVAVVDSNIHQHMNQSEINSVDSSVAKFNGLPSTVRHNLHQSGTYTPKGINSCCAYRWTLNWYWWGARIWLNSSAAQNFNYAMGILGAAIGAAVGAGIGALPGAVIGAVIGAIAASAAAWIDNECGNRGIFIDINWLLQVSLNPVC